jgi:hypothetical protein
MTKSELLRDIEIFLLQHPEVSATALGRRVCNDPAAVFRLRKGLGLTMRRAEQFREFMDAYRDGKSRPKRAKSRSRLRSSSIAA